jgi:sec-independent protein translocase protein TatB
MPSFSDSIFLFVLALLLFGPKRLPVLAREVGKWVGEFRRASNEFKMQMEEELRLSEQADRQKQIAAIEAAAPLPPSLDQPEHPHLPSTTTADTSDTDSSDESRPEPSQDGHPDAQPHDLLTAEAADPPSAANPVTSRPASETIDGVPVLPIATSGDLRMMPPSTGLPTPRQPAGNPLGGLLDSIPESRPETRTILESEAPHAQPETAAHGH